MDYDPAITRPTPTLSVRPHSMAVEVGVMPTADKAKCVPDGFGGWPFAAMGVPKSRLAHWFWGEWVMRFASNRAQPSSAASRLPTVFIWQFSPNSANNSFIQINFFSRCSEWVAVVLFSAIDRSRAGILNSVLGHMPHELDRNPTVCVVALAPIRSACAAGGAGGPGRDCLGPVPGGPSHDDRFSGLGIKARQVNCTTSIGGAP